MSKNNKFQKEQGKEIAIIEQAAPAFSAPAPQKPKPKSAGARIYVGPTLIKHGLVENTVFKGYELPKNVQALANENPCIRSLIVPVSRLTHVQARLNDTTSLEFKNLQAAKKIN